jgi:hypothetical protein
VPSFRTGTVVELWDERPGLQRLLVDLGGGTAERAYALTALTGPTAVGHRVVVNTTAVELGLGTGGWHVVHWDLDRDELVRPGDGHVVKLRYTSLQADVGAAEEHHGEPPAELGGTPVVACTVHSQVGVVAAAVAEAAPGTRLVHVMTDGAALPLVLSDLVAELVARRLVVGTVTAGHAFGGDLEAVSVPSALALARHVLGAEVVVVGMGPGVVGTGTRLGTTAVEAAAVLDTAAALGGVPVLCLRASSGDARDRHAGVSHHATTVLHLARAAVEVPVAELPDEPVPERHRLVTVPVDDPAAPLRAASLEVTTMGRGPGDDPAFFAHAVAAGRHAAAIRVPSAPHDDR